VTHPKTTDDELGKTIAVDLSHNELHLWNGFHVVKTYPVATAQPGFSTPVGRWEVVDKVEMPTWVNPCPGGGCWAASEPPTIGPGLSNPLGLRALYRRAPLRRGLEGELLADVAGDQVVGRGPLAPHRRRARAHGDPRGRRRVRRSRWRRVDSAKGRPGPPLRRTSSATRRADGSRSTSAPPCRSPRPR